MDENNTKQLSRRDALKVLGAAAGATALANLPNKWSSPELLSGVLPAHAQTSLCYAVTVEVLSTDGIANGGSMPMPEENAWTGEAGGYVRYYCQEGCVQIYLFLDSGTTATYQITTISEQFSLTLGAEETRDILINMGTGEYGLDFETSPAGCEWGVIGIGDSRSNPAMPTFLQ